MSSDREAEYAQLRRELNYRLDFITAFVDTMKDGTRSNSFVLYEFQALMDGLIPIKEKIDQLTRTLDHG